MWVLKTEAGLDYEHINMLREQFKKRTGEDCIILTHGLTAEWIPTENDKAVSGQETAQPKHITSRKFRFPRRH